jgi:hypothetical protein
MGTVLPFQPRKAKTASAVAPSATAPASLAAAGLAVTAAVDAGGDRRDVLAAAGPLLAQCRDRYGFTVMRAGLPGRPDTLAAALLTLARGLALLDAQFSGRPFSSYGVYFGHDQLGWFEDGYGDLNGLALPVDTDPAALAEFVSPRLRAHER